MKSKRFFVTLLAIVLLAVCVIPSAYSWYDHNGSLTGDRVEYVRENLPVSAGAVTIETKKYRTENNKLWYDVKGNKEYAKDNQNQELPPITGSSSVDASSVQYYGTTITNTGSAPAYVNLYLKDFTNSPTVKIGTLQPSLTHKGISSSVHLTNKNKVRVYFQWDKAKIWKDAGSRTYVISETSDGTKTVTQFDTTNNKLVNKSELSNVTTYYADLADNAISFYFATDAGTTSNVNSTTGEVSQAWYRTRAITNIQAERGYYLTGAADDTTWNAQYGTFNIPGGISVKTYFDTMTINENQHAYVTLNQGTNMTGASASYAVTEGSNISVNGNTGYVTTTNYSGSATITTTITGSLGDTTTVDTSVTNPGTVNATVVLNVKVPGKNVEDGENGTAEIVWYIDNSKGSDDVQFSNVYYTK